MIPTMSPAEASELASLSLAIAAEAGTMLRAGYRTKFAIEHKGSTRDLVTAFDRESEALIVEQLRALVPEASIIGEEGQGIERPGPLAFHVDPLDGTTNFAHGHPFWAVSVGAAFHGIPIAGAVVAPALGIAWHGTAVGPSFRDGSVCQVSDTSTLEGAMLATGFPPERDEEPISNLSTFVRMKRIVQSIRRCGSAAIDICLVADGTYDGYWERALHSWDTCAGLAIASGAGARITNLTGQPADFTRGQIIVSNGRVHDAMVRGIGAGTTLRPSRGAS